MTFANLDQVICDTPSTTHFPGLTKIKDDLNKQMCIIEGSSNLNLNDHANWTFECSQNAHIGVVCMDTNSHISKHLEVRHILL